MRNFTHIIFTILLCNCGIVSFSQKKQPTPQTPQQRKESSIEIAFNVMGNYLKRGDYEKAYTMSSRLASTSSSSENKQRINVINKQAKKLLNLKYEAYTALRGRNYKLALQKYDAILRENATDTVTKKDKEGLVRMMNQPKESQLEKILSQADKSFDAAKDKKNSFAKREYELRKARQIWSVIQQTRNYQDEFITKNIAAADEIISNIESSKIAIKNGNIDKAKKITEQTAVKYPEIDIPSLEPPKLKPKPNPVSKSATALTVKNKTETNFDLGRKALNRCDYDSALVYFKKDYKIQPGLKNKKFLDNIGFLIKYTNDLEIYKKNSNFSFNDVLAIYEKIKKINADLELTEPNSSCKKINKEIVSYTVSVTPKIATSFSCEKIYSIKAVLDSYEVSTAEKEKLQGLITTCETLTNVCKTSNKIIADRIKEAIRLHKEGFEDASNSSLNVILSEIEKIKTDCKDFDGLPFIIQINEYKQKNDKLITLKECQDKQKIKFQNAGNLANNQDYEKALATYNSIDTTCINNTFKESLAREQTKNRIIYNEKMLKTNEDSAYIYKNKKPVEFEKEAKFLIKAYSFAANRQDSVRIENKYKLNKCVQENGGKCPEKEVKNIAGMVTCKDTTQKQTKIQILFGINTGTPKTAIFIPTILIESTRQSGKYSESAFIGLGINRQSFIKKIDYSADIFYTIPYNISFLSSTNRLSEISFHSFDSDFKLKFHKIKVCPTMGRSYVFLGVNSGYKKIHKSGSDLLASDTYLRDNYTNAIHLGYLAGLGYEFPKDKLSFEIGYKRQSLFYANKNVYSPFKAPFSLGLLSIKLGFAIN
jgi:hypothetical protein